MSENKDKEHWIDKASRKFEAFATGSNCKRGKAQREAFDAFGGFMMSIGSIAILLGIVVAFGIWGLAVIGAIIAVNVLTTK